MADTSHRQPSLYETDFYAWANEQAELLRSRRLDQAEIDNIAEEIESMGRSEKRELVSRLSVLLVHLLKWRFQPRRRGKSWRLTIELQRLDIQQHLSDNPSLKSQLEAIMAIAYRRARIESAKQTRLATDSFPASCPWSYDDIIADAFWPEA